MESPGWTRVPAKGDVPSHLVYTKPLEKPDLDKREYRVICLDNGLRAVLIHDEKTDKAAAAMNVGVGNLSDPEDMPGLAHFCEHLLFMGTKAFPDENEYSHFIKSHGGSTNAYTSTSNTCYYFSIGADHLAGAIDRFSGFFHSPLFDPSCTTRELNAVDSEHKKNGQSDVFRLWQVFRAQAIPGHSWSKFGTGSLESLTEAARKLKQTQHANDITLNEEEGDGGFVGRETRRRLIEWWETHYCASIMSLAILGREPLDDLAKLAIARFSPIPNHGLSWPTETVPWGSNEQGMITFAKSVMDINLLELSFALDRQDIHYESKPANFLSHFIGHEGPGSLHSYLKQKGWVTQLWSGPQNSARGFGFMKINAKLTRSGLQNYQAVLEAIYSYLSLLRSEGFQPWAFDEFRSLGEIGFRFMQKSSPEGYASRLSELLSRPVPTDRLISGAMKVWTANGPLATKILYEDLAPERGSVMLSSKDFGPIGLEGPWSKEKWYGTEYIRRHLDPDILERAREPNTIKELQLPHPNEFIPRDLHVDRKEVKEPAKRPSLIRRSEVSDLWYKKDDQFWLPKGYIGVYLRSPVAYSSCKNVVTTKLVEHLITDALTEYSYDASLAGLNYALSFDEDGDLILQTSGYTDKMLALLQHLLETTRSHQVKEDRLSVFKQELAQYYENQKNYDPWLQARGWTEYTFREEYRMVDDLLKELPLITTQDVQYHIGEIFSRARTKVLVTGNFAPQDAFKVQDLVEKTLGTRPILPSEALTRTLLLPVGSNFVANKTLYNPKEINNAIEYCLQIADSNEGIYARLLLFGHLVNQPTFAVLRTQEQLGYIVSSSTWSQVNTVSMLFRIQSEKSPVFLDNRIDAFLETFKDTLSNMKDEDFEKQRRGLVVKLREKLDNLDQESSRFGMRILDGTYDFMLREKTASIVEGLILSDVLEFFSKYIDPASSTRSKLAMHIYSQVPASQTTNFSIAASETFLVDLKANQVPVDETQYRELSKAEPAVDTVVKFWDTYLSKLPNLPAERKVQLLERVDQLAKENPANTKWKSEGKLKEGVVLIEDLAKFKKSLQASAPARAVMALEVEEVPVLDVGSRL